VWVDSDRIVLAVISIGEGHGDRQFLNIGRAAHDVLQHIGPQVSGHVEFDFLVAFDRIGVRFEQLGDQPA